MGCSCADTKASTSMDKSFCGVIVIDGNQAVLGEAIRFNRGVRRLARVTSTTMSRTRRGGQSAPRFARKREVAELAYLRRVSEKAEDLLRHAGSLMIGGKADMKRKLLQELPLALRVRVIRVVTVDCSSGADSLQKVASGFDDAIADSEHKDATRCVQQFFDSIGRTFADCCYGVTATLLALESGAVDCLLLPEGLGTDGERLLSLAAATGASVVHITPRCEIDHRFCQSYRVGGFLRWPAELDVEDVQEVSLPCSEHDSEADDDLSDASTTDAESERGSALLSAWVCKRLSSALGDACTAEALAACVEVLLALNDEPVPERIIQAAELLRDQGVPEAVLEEFGAEAASVYDLFDD